MDFAYAVHTDIGNRCVAVKINQELMPLRTELKNGDRVEIITAAHAKPNPLWLNFVVTAKARSHIRHFVKTMHFQESVQLGERLLNQALVRSSPARTSSTATSGRRLLKESSAKSRQHLLSDIGLGKRLAIVIARQLLSLAEPAGNKTRAAARQPDHSRLRGHGGAVREMLQADSRRSDHRHHQQGTGHGHPHPRLPGDAQDAPRSGEWLDVEWEPETRKLFEVSIKLVVANQRGVLAKVAAEIAATESNIQNVARSRRRQRLHHHALHAAGVQPPASRADHARPAPHSRSDPHLATEGLTHRTQQAIVWAPEKGSSLTAVAVKTGESPGAAGSASCRETFTGR